MKKITTLTLLFFTILIQGQNKLLSSVEEYYNGTSWEQDYAANYIYDSNNNLLSEESFDWDSTLNSWVAYYQFNYVYNESQKVIQDISKEWNTTTQQYDTYYKTDYSYTGDLLTEMIYQVWNDDNWVLDGKVVLQYNEDNKLDTVNFIERDGLEWVLEDRSIYNYNTDGEIIENTDEEFDGSDWKSDYRISYTYNVNNEIETEIGENWEDNAWVIDSEFSFTYDTNGNRISETENYYDYGVYKNEYVYDTSVLESSLATPFKDLLGLGNIFNELVPVNKLLTRTINDYNDIDETFEVYSRTTYNYDSHLTLSTNTIQSDFSSVKIYPNPSVDYIQVKGLKTVENYEILNAGGSKVMSGVTYNNKQINVQNLKQGVYFLTLKNRKVIKFIKSNN